MYVFAIIWMIVMNILITMAKRDERNAMKKSAKKFQNRASALVNFQFFFTYIRPVTNKKNSYFS